MMKILVCHTVLAVAILVAQTGPVSAQTGANSPSADSKSSAAADAKGRPAQQQQQQQQQQRQQQAGTAKAGAQQQQAAGPQKAAASGQAQQASQTKPGATQAKGQGDQANTPAKQTTQTTPTRVDVDTLAENPGAYVGQSVRVRGEIEEFLGPQSFTLDEDSFTATTDVLVILPRASAVLRDDADVVVQGVVHQLTRAQLERDYDWFGLDRDWVMRFEQRPIIMANALQNQKGADLLVKEGAKQDAQAAPVRVEPGNIARSPDKYMGRRVQAVGEIEDVFGGRVFTLDEEALFAGPDVLVIAQQPSGAVVDGNDVQVTGTLRRFTWAELRSDYGFLDLDRDLVVEFENRPVLIANSIARAPD